VLATDALTVDVVDGVEAIDATPAPVSDSSALLPTLGRIRVVRSRGRLVARAITGDRDSLLDLFGPARLLG